MNPMNIAGWSIAGVLAVGGFAYVVNCNNNARFKDEAIELGKRQIEELKKIAANNLKAKEDSDAQRTKETAALQRTVKRLRDQRASAREVPAAPAASSRPDLACFDRSEFAGALRERGESLDRFRNAVLELVGEGATSTVDLDAAKAWAGRLTMSYELQPQ